MFCFDSIAAVSAALLREAADGYADADNRKEHQHDDYSDVGGMAGLRRLAARIGGGFLRGSFGEFIGGGYFSGYLGGFFGRVISGRRTRVSANHRGVIRLAVIVIIIVNDKTQVIGRRR